MSGYLLAIDIGSATTVAALTDHDRDGWTPPRLLGDPRQPSVASAVYLDPDRGVIAGTDAVRSAATDPARFEPNPKRRIDDGALVLGDSTVPILDVLTAIVADRVQEAVRQANGGQPLGLVLTHPADWGALRCHLLRRAGRRYAAKVTLVPEPLAAAARLRAVGSVRPDQPVAVYDFGGGTFDATVVGFADGRPAVLASGGFAGAGGCGGGCDGGCQLHRPLVERSVEVLAETVAASRVPAGELAVLMVGGASRMPRCAAAVTERLGRAPLTLEQPETVVCLGALAVAVAEGVADEPAADPVAASATPPVSPSVPSPASSNAPAAPPAGAGGAHRAASGRHAWPARGQRRWPVLAGALVLVLLAVAGVAAVGWPFGPFGSDAAERTGDPGGLDDVNRQQAQRIVNDVIPPAGQFSELLPFPRDAPPVAEGFEPDASSLLCGPGTPPAPAEATGRLAAARSTLSALDGQVDGYGQQLLLDAVYLTGEAAEQIGEQVADGVAACIRDGTGDLINLRPLDEEVDVPPGRSWVGFAADADEVDQAGGELVQVTCINEVVGRIALRSCSASDQGPVVTNLLAVRGLNELYERAAGHA